MKTANSKGQIFYGLHFYPGVAEYSEPDKNYRIYLNEKTLRKMNPTFAGRPVYVDHVDDVSPDVDVVKAEADGWVVESFFNEADGKTWAKFIVVTDRALKAIQQGYKLSNAYICTGFGPGGLWNGVTYEKEVLGAEYEHLAIVKNPRYEESLIYTPEQFKQYCEEQRMELKRLANSKETSEMKLSFFKKQKVENSVDYQDLVVILPKTGVEKTVVQLVNEADEAHANKGYANEDDLVKLGNEECTVKELVEKYNQMSAEKENAQEPEMENEEDDELENEDEELENVEDDEEAKKKALELAMHEEEEILEKKKENKKKNFNKLKNAPKVAAEPVRIDLMDDQISRGRSRYGSL